MMLTLKQKRTGFTIVELLVVIVVIAILATIAIVAYQGIQQRAVTAAYSSAVDQWDKFFQMEIAVAGSLPTTNATCVGRSSADFPAGDGFNAGDCLNYTIGSTTYRFGRSSTFFDALQTQSGLPSGLLPVSNVSLTNSYKSRGILVSVNSSARYYLLQWYPQVAQQCGRGQPSVDGSTPGALTGGSCVLMQYY